MHRLLLTLLLVAAAAPGQKYAGPRPSKPDVPFLLHADNLVSTEVTEAKEEPRKDDLFFVVAGATSPVKTPLASPVFVIQAEKIAPERLQMFRLESKNGKRELLFTRKKKPMARPIRLTVTPLAPGNLFRIEADESLENGEYALTPDGSNESFCFQVY